MEVYEAVCCIREDETSQDGGWLLTVKLCFH
jgi:hypothetical protein